MIKNPKEILVFPPTEEIDCYSLFIQGPKYPIYLEANEISELGKKLAQHISYIDIDNFAYVCKSVVENVYEISNFALGKFYDSYKEKKKQEKNIKKF